MDEVAGAAATGPGGGSDRTIHFSPLDPELAADFWPRTNALRESCPVGWSDQPWSEREAGIHRCLGNHLARREIKASIKAICALSRFEVEKDFVPRYRPAFARGPMSLPVNVAR